MKKVLTVCLCIVLLLSCGLFLCGCGDKEEEDTVPFGDEYYNNIGAGRTSFYFELVDQSGFIQRFQINTDAVYLMEAFRENNMILSPYGEKTTAIAGIVADGENGFTWVLYEKGKAVEGNYEELKITRKQIYSFVAERT